MIFGEHVKDNLKLIINMILINLLNVLVIE